MGYFNAPIHGLPRNAFASDQAYVMTAPFVDITGNLWPAGTAYVNGPIAIDDARPGSPLVQTVSIGGKFFQFMGRATKPA